MVVSGVTLCSASPALGAGPWWHLTAVPVPGHLHGGVARNEVQEIIAAPETLFELKVNGTVAFFESEPYAFNVVPHATHENVQAALEAAYGAGNVVVTGGPGGAAPLVVTSVKEDASRQVPSISIGEVPVGSASAKVAIAGRPDGEIVVTASNLGDASATGEASPITLSDKLPPGWEAVSIKGVKAEGLTSGGGEEELSCSLTPTGEQPGPSCTSTGLVHPLVPPYATLTLHLAVVDAGATAGEPEDEATVGGGGVGTISIKRPVPLSESTPFGIADYELVNENEGGAADTQAGSHPFQQTTTVLLNQRVNEQNGGIEPAAIPRDFHFNWPAGLVGNPSAIPQCQLKDFQNQGKCPPQTAVGVTNALVTINGKINAEGAPQLLRITVPLFNLAPSPGEPARLGFFPDEPVYIDPSVRSGHDYGITVNVENTSQLVGLRTSEVTVWGVPGDPIHDGVRGLECLSAELREASCQPTHFESPTAFLSLPTSCTGPQVSTVTGDSWLESLPTDQQAQLASFPMPALDGCDALPFNPSIVVIPDGHEASRPMGLNVDVHVPQEESLNPKGLSVADPKSIAVTLPEGVTVNPSSGDGLQACSESLVGFEGRQELNRGSEPGVRIPTFKPFLPGSIAAKTAVESGEAPMGEAALEPGVNFCADASKIGEVRIKTPLLPPTQPLKGSVYLATQNQNPFGSLIALYLIAEDPVSGTLVRIAGQTHLSATGQLETSFENSPQAPFEDAEIHFFGGERAPLTSPAHCGAYTTTASLTPWTGGGPVAASSTFNITSGPGGSPCPGATLPFSPSLTGGTTNINAGSFSPLVTTIGRDDGQQNLQQVTLHMPAGLEGLLSNVKLCPEAQANEGTCGPESLIGETTVSAGVGNSPVTVKGGRVYLTEKYAGAPFGLSIVNPVKAGPFDLEHDTSNPAQNPACDCVVVRAKIEVNPHTAELTVTTDESGQHAIPHLIDGIPVQIKAVNVTINRPGFTFNPTNCNPMKIEGSIASDEGASSHVSVPFQATNCKNLNFTPQFQVSTSGKTSKARGASLTAKVSEPAGSLGTQANLARVKVELPKQLPSRLTTLQRACTNAQFEANPAACPPESKVGYAVVHTPLLPVPLTGPAIFVSHGGEAFPSLIIVLQGYGVTVDLVGTTFISKAGITSTTFKTVPDTPFNTFELTLPEGTFSALGTNKNLCALVKTVTTKTRVRGRVHGKTKTVARKTTKHVAEGLIMPTEFVAQNGAAIHQNTPVTVTGCRKARKAKAGTKKPKGRKKK
jgi:hypothetical protein